LVVGEAQGVLWDADGMLVVLVESDVGVHLSFRPVLEWN